eukprot:5127236-Prymnesium_polylepis.1
MSFVQTCWQSNVYQHKWNNSLGRFRVRTLRETGGAGARCYAAGQLLSVHTNSEWCDAETAGGRWGTRA